MEDSLQLMEKLYAADSFSGFIQSLTLPYPVGAFSCMLAPLFLPEEMEGFSLKQHTPYPCASPSCSQAEGKPILSPFPGGICGLDLSIDGCYAGTLLLGAPVEEALADAQALSRAACLALELFGNAGPAIGEEMDVFLTGLEASEQPLTCLYCDVDASDRTAGRLLAELCAAVPVLHCCRCGSRLAVLFTGADARHKDISSIINNAGCSAGISGPFSSPLLAMGCTQKAQRAAAFALPGTTVSFGSIRWQSFCAEAAPIIASKGFSAEDFLHDGLLRLLTCDKENATGYFESLYAYLSHGKSLRSAAEVLNLHRNTLDYRIRRIRELFDLDLEDQNTCFELLFSCRLYLALVKGGEA